MTTVNDNSTHLSTPRTASGISVRSLWKVFGKNEHRALEEPFRNMSRSEIQQKTGLVAALRDVSFDVNPGETFVVMGLSGSGKSTLVRCLINLIEATAGSIIVNGNDVTNFDSRQLRDFRRSEIAMVFQNFGLLPHKNVLDNAAYGLEIKGMDKESRYHIAHEMLNKVGLNGWEHANQRELSGGMQQRVGLARALAMDPSILLMDEPFSGLDPLIRRQMRDELADLQAEIQKTVVFITHDLDEAISIGDRIAIMRDGEIIQVGSPKEIITEPVDEFVREFTQGISKTKVIDISECCSTPEVIFNATDDHDLVRSKMDDAMINYAVGLDSDNQYLGLVSRSTLEREASSSMIVSHLSDSNVTPVLPDTSLEHALSLITGHNLPIPVIDENDKFIGVVTHKSLLEVIAGNS